MSLLTLQAAGFDYGRQTILDAANLTLHHGERYGLVGVNGAGKSTLLRLIAGELVPTRGKVEKASRASIGYLTQDTTVDLDLPMVEAVRQQAFGDLLRLEQRLQELGERMATDSSDELMEEYGRLHERFEQADGYTLQPRCEAALLGLGFTMDRLQQPVGTLSGGQRRRAALAAVLLAPHDLLLLDEPTNHLDLEAREWLEEHLSGRKTAVVTISHDRTFLDHATNLTLHLFNGKLSRYQGSYTPFMKQWLEQKAQWEKHYAAQKDHIARTEAFIRKNLAGVRTNQAKSRRKQLDRLERMDAPPGEGRQLSFHIEPARQSGAVALEGHDLGKRFGDLQLFSGLDFQVLRGEKVGILGANGTGKSTLLKMLARVHAPDEGRVVVGANVDLGYYDQELSLVNDSNTVFGELRALEPLASEGELRSLLAAFGFGEDRIEQRVNTLSGGERARLSLLVLMMQKHNTLLLDEPTNHLDTDTREALEEALDGFEGTLVVVSHDRYFLNRLCDRIFGFEAPAGGGNARVRQVAGNYDDYRRAVLAERAARGGASVPGGPAAGTAAGGGDAAPRNKRELSKNELAKLRREVGDLEEEIALLELALEETGEAMSEGASSGEEMAQLARRADEQQRQLDRTLERWEELSRLLERDTRGGPGGG